jgi:DNA-binding transcriptional MerR regulator
LRISELAARTGVPATTLRYYEQVGLLSASRTPNGYRAYDERAVERLRFIGAAKRLDLSLDSIRGLLRAWEEEPCRSVKSRLRPMIGARLTETRQGIAALTELADSLQAGLQRLDLLPDRDHACDPSCTFLDRPLTDTVATARTTDSTGEEAEQEPLACSLTSGAQQDRLTRWHELLADLRTRPVPGGALVDVPIDKILDVAELITAEQECCPFFRFELSFGRPVAQLRIAADDPALVAALLPQDAAR